MTTNRPIHIALSGDLLNACRKAIAANRNISTYADLFNARLNGEISPIVALPEQTRVKVFLTEEQLDEVRKTADDAGMSVSAYICSVYQGTLDRKHEA